MSQSGYPFEFYRPSAMEVWGLADRGRRLLTELDELDGQVSDSHREAVEAVTDELERPVDRSGEPISRNSRQFGESTSFAQGALGLWAGAILQYNETSTNPRSISKLNAVYENQPGGATLIPELEREKALLRADLDQAAANIATMIEHGPSAEYVELMVAQGALPLSSPLIPRYLGREATSTDQIARAATTIRTFSAGGWLEDWSVRPIRVLREELADLTPEEMDALFSSYVLSDEDLAALNDQLANSTDVDRLAGLSTTIWSAVNEDTGQRLHETMSALEPGLYGWTGIMSDSGPFYDSPLDLVPVDQSQLLVATRVDLDGSWSGPAVDDEDLERGYEEIGNALQTLYWEHPDWPQEHITSNDNGTYTISLDDEFWRACQREEPHYTEGENWLPAQAAVEVTVSGYLPEVTPNGPPSVADWVRLVQKAAAPYAMSTP